MRICFVLPRFSRGAQGGYKMVYEYANRLTDRGHIVDILYLNDTVMQRFAVPWFIKRAYANYLTMCGPRWFQLDSRVENISNLKKEYEKTLEKADVVIATAIETVPIVKKSNCHRKAYFIQDFENWNCSDRIVYESYGEGFQNIVISSWLKEKVDIYSQQPAILIKNPVDTTKYKMICPLRERYRHSVSLLYHQKPHKGFKYAFEAVLELKKRYPDLRVKVFGVYSRPKEFPEFIEYTRSATAKQTIEIYNSSAVFLCATVAEGYGLTGLEAMACGAALVSTDYQGVHEYATDGVNALLSPVKDVDALVSNVSMLFDNDELRYQIAEVGMKSVQKDFNWDVAVDKFEKAITE